MKNIYSVFLYTYVYDDCLPFNCMTAFLKKKKKNNKNIQTLRKIILLDSSDKQIYSRKLLLLSLFSVTKTEFVECDRHQKLCAATQFISIRGILSI